ncbi:hypothetical protein ACOI1H_19735 [Loktanella sp. DJP18]|uniref:hypothetical protein n=1 Tax=Loktanella sp. DJP18 TaxID=3409788 RepID=UPI003BB70ABD
MSTASDQWRALALQFDGHRIEAIQIIKALVAGQDGAQAMAETFLSRPHLPGEQVLAARVAEIASCPK